jgi:hypothetical protein
METIPPMRNILIASVLMASVAGAAFAADKPAPKPAPAAASAKSVKATDCAKQWKAEKKHTQTRKAFMAACTKG